ncbi:hypothetical protein BD410DRAFT_265081 [Rickenella mellea]|uniref:Uncharacterized protein n=1 Tax=Rickenella mellea TaxID=50990 RepID=A0A4Y7PGW9_9AGAM|nr:hypothetical protein BD410DRAFT_265081 [Rickenella mellea]
MGRSKATAITYRSHLSRAGRSKFSSQHASSSLVPPEQRGSFGSRFVFSPLTSVLLFTAHLVAIRMLLGCDYSFLVMFYHMRSPVPQAFAKTPQIYRYALGHLVVEGRCVATDATLVLQGGPGSRVATHAHLAEVLKGGVLGGSKRVKRAVCVEFCEKTVGGRYGVSTREEIIFSAGAVHTLQIRLLSGVRPAARIDTLWTTPPSPSSIKSSPASPSTGFARCRSAIR